MKEKTLLDILGDFQPSLPDPDQAVKSGGSINIWLPARAKARYDELQERSGRQFSKKIREAVLVLMDLAEARVG